MTASKPLVEAVGILESCFKEKFGAPRQPLLVPAATARLRIRKAFLPEQSLKGLSGFSHVWLLGYMHLNTQKAFRSTVHPPRLEGKTVGVFASRSPHRPSPISLTVARLERIEGDTLYLSGKDLVDGTPILDVKPYLPAYDCVPKARAGWTARAAPRRLKVCIQPAALRRLRTLEADGRPGLVRLVRQALSHDPRNPRDRSQLRTPRTHYLWVFDRDVRFTIRRGRAVVTGVVPGAKERHPRPVVSPWG